MCYNMGDMKSRSVSWLPVDNRLFPFISFGHVKGIARLFLEIEIICALLVVAGTIVLTIFWIFR